jgi:small neutral amino acid transporter SnatA (MarC family)
MLAISTPKIMRGLALLILQILGAVLGVLQVALSIQIVIWALTELGVLGV